MGAIELGAAFAMGFMGSGHCVAMCGGLAGVLSSAPASRVRLPLAPSENRSRSLGTILATHAGRLATYGALGALGGAIGATMKVVVPLGTIQVAARLLAAVTLLLVAAHLAGLTRRLARVERIGGWVARVPRRWLGASMSGRAGAALVRGAIWGLVPCGLVYGAVALALASASIAGGIATLIAFGLGTMPALLLVGGLADAVRGWARHPRVRMTIGLLVGLSGALQLTLAALDVGVVRWPGGAGERPCCAARHQAEAIERAAERTP